MTLISFRPSFVLALATQFSVSSVLFFLIHPHSGLFSVRHLLSFLTFSPFFPNWFLIHYFLVLILGFLFVSFHPSLFRSHSRFTGASLLFHFLTSVSLLGFFAVSTQSLTCFWLLSFLLFLFPSSWISLAAVHSVLISSSEDSCLFSIGLWYSAYCDFFHRCLSHLTVATSSSSMTLRF